jgi:hypothetical protein
MRNRLLTQVVKHNGFFFLDKGDKEAFLKANI